MYLKEPGWVLIVSLPAEVMFGQVEKFALTTFSIMGVGVVVVILLTILLANRVTQPVLAVAAGAERIAQGRWHERVTAKDKKGELAQLVCSFNRMAGSLQESCRALEHSKRSTENIVATVPSGLVVIGEKSEVLSVNRSFCELFNVTRQQVVGQNVDTVLQTIGLSQECRDAIAARMPFRNLECSCSVPGKGELTLNLTLSGIRLAEEEEEEEEEVLLVIEDITERKRGDLERQVMYEIIQGVTMTADLDELMQLIHQALKKVIYAENYFIALYDYNTGLFSFPYFVDKFDTAPSPQALEKSCTAYVFRTGRPMLITEELFQQLIEQGEVELIGTPSPSWLGVPLRTPSEIIGVQVVQHYEDEHAYSERDVEFFASVGSQVALALERKRAEEEVRKRKEYLETLMDSSMDLIFTVRKDGTFNFANKRLKDILGYTFEEIKERHFWEFIPSEMHPFMQDRWLEIQKGIGGAYETKVIKKDGSVVDCLVSHSKLEGQDEYLACLKDISERKRAEEALHRSVSLLTATLESTADGILVVDTEGKIVSFNQKFVDMWRIPASVIESRDDNQALAFVLDQLKDPDAFLKRVRELYAQPEVEGNDILEFKDGRVFERYSHPQKLAGSTVGRVWSFRDITERLRLEEQLRQAQKMESLGTLASGIAHDFNNILGIILGYTSVLEQATAHPEKLRRSVEAISKAVQRGADLVKQLLTFARKTDVLIESVNVNDVVEELLQMLRETFPKMITFSLELESAEVGLPSIQADRGQLYQALLNLCVNARDAMPSGGTLSISTGTIEGAKVRERFPGATAEEYVTISVADTGIGMDRAKLSRIFEPFFTTKEVGKGVGLGLAVVYGIVQTHQGFIDVESEVGRGTTFHLYFPVSRRELEAGRRGITEEGEVPGGTETILVVEDEELLLELVQSLLESKGYKVLRANDGVEAVKQYAEHKEEIAVVLIDMGLPKLGGHEVFLHLQALNPGVKVILASGFIDPSVSSEMYRAGAKHFIQKPYSPDEVLRTVRKVIDMKE